MPNPLPVLQGYWRLLERGEKTQQGDDCLSYGSVWEPIREDQVGVAVFTAIVRRRVPPPPTCATCPEFQHKECVHESGPYGVPRDGSGYCSFHPKAQEVTR